MQRLTAALVASAGALALAFAVVAAKAFPGRTAHATVRRVTHAAPPKPETRQTAPPLVQIGSPPQAQSAPASPAPAPTPAAPVVVSGGS